MRKGADGRSTACYSSRMSTGGHRAPLYLTRLQIPVVPSATQWLLKQNITIQLVTACEETVDTRVFAIAFKNAHLHWRPPAAVVPQLVI
jgi:hypothetical protein